VVSKFHLRPIKNLAIRNKKTQQYNPVPILLAKVEALSEDGPAAAKPCAKTGLWLIKKSQAPIE
jgi:hypothetical protein